MTKSEYLEVLIPQLERLYKEEHVIELAVKGYYDEVKTIFEECDYSSLCEYMKQKNAAHRDPLKVSDIPREYLEVHLLYLLYSGWNEDTIMECKNDYQEALDELGIVGKAGAEKMDYCCLSGVFGIEDLMAPEEDAVD